MLVISNVTIVLKNHLIWDGSVLIKDGYIVEAGETKNVEVPADTDRFDGQGAYLAPGLIDIHTHAAGGYWFFENPEAAAEVSLYHGTTTVLPALYVNMDTNAQVEALKKWKSLAKTEKGRNIGGAYMEGNYINPKFGCDISSNKWTGAIDEKAYMPVVREAGDFAKVWCIAPERPGIDAFVRNVKAAIPSITFAVAHSEATPEEVEKYIPEGLRIGTHHTNATGTLDKYPECRGVCVDEAVNMNDEIYAELICDSMGIHVDPYMLRLVVKIKGKSRIILISDACVYNGPKPPGYDGVDDINFDDVGQIAGSKLTLDKACQNMMKHTGCSLCDVFQYASYNPAKVLGMNDRGLIQKGKRADLVLVDDKMNVKHVFIQGKKVR